MEQTAWDVVGRVIPNYQNAAFWWKAQVDIQGRVRLWIRISGPNFWGQMESTQRSAAVLRKSCREATIPWLDASAPLAKLVHSAQTIVTPLVLPTGWVLDRPMYSLTFGTTSGLLVIQTDRPGERVEKWIEDLRSAVSPYLVPREPDLPPSEDTPGGGPEVTPVPVVAVPGERR